jgi:hypothetical protein
MACSVGGSQSSVAPPLGGTDTVVAVGNTMTDNNKHSVRVLGFQKTGSLPNGSQCLQVSVSVTNAATVAWQGPLSSLRVDDSHGYAHYGLTPCGDNTALSTLDPGQSATAIVYFDVYPNTALDLTWTPDPAKPTVTYSTALK